MKIKEIYKIFCKLVGISAVLCLTFGISLGLFGIRFQLHEPIIWIAIPEMIIGFMVLPYLFKSLLETN